MQSRMLYIIILFAMLGINNAMAASSFFNTGERLARSLVKTGWNNVDRDCDKIDDLFRIFENSMARLVAKMERISQNDGSSSAKEFADGYVSGMINASDEITLDCPAQCSEVGSKMGKNIAFLFCKVSILVGGTWHVNQYIERFPSCGNNECQSGFSQVARNCSIESFAEPEKENVEKEKKCFWIFCF